MHRDPYQPIDALRNCPTTGPDPSRSASTKLPLVAYGGRRTLLPQAYVIDLRAASDDRYIWGWQAMATPRRMLQTHTGHVPGFMAEVVVDRAGEFAVFALSNTGHFAEDGTSWVLGRIDQALAEVLKQQSMALGAPGVR